MFTRRASLLWTASILAALALVIATKPQTQLTHDELNELIHKVARVNELTDILSCKPCEPGYGLVARCTKTRQTICQSCEEGYYSSHRPHFKPCRLCAECGSDMYAEYACKRTHDTRCDQCATKHPNYNADFVRKCLNTDSLEEDYDSAAGNDSVSIEVDIGESIPDRAEGGKDPAAGKAALPNGHKKIAFEAAVSSEDEHELQLIEQDESEEVDDSDLHEEPPNKDPTDSQHFKHFDGQRVELHKKINYKPSNHNYPIEELLHNQKRRGLILLGLSLLVLFTVLIFVGIFVKIRCDRRYNGYRRFYSRLSQQDIQLIREASGRLEAMEASPKKQQCAQPGLWPGYPERAEKVPRIVPIVINIQENPLEPLTDRLPPSVQIEQIHQPQRSPHQSPAAPKTVDA